MKNRTALAAICLSIIFPLRIKAAFIEIPVPTSVRPITNLVGFVGPQRAQSEHLAHWSPRIGALPSAIDTLSGAAQRAISPARFLVTPAILESSKSEIDFTVPQVERPGVAGFFRPHPLSLFTAPLLPTSALQRRGMRRLPPPAKILTAPKNPLSLADAILAAFTIIAMCITGYWAFYGAFSEIVRLGEIEMSQ